MVVCLYDDTDHDSAKNDETNVITVKNTLIFSDTLIAYWVEKVSVNSSSTFWQHKNILMWTSVFIVFVLTYFDEESLLLAREAL
jgi:hypothetical protein